MEKTRILLAGMWIVLMLTYLLGDVMRIFSGDFVAGEIEDTQVSQGMWLGMAVLMLLPIIMILLNLSVGQPIMRWVNIVMAGIFFLVNAVGLPGYPSLFDKFLIAVGLVMNILTVWIAWGWV